MQIRIAFQGALLGLWFCFFAASFCYSNGETIEVAGEQAAAKAFSELQRAEAAEVNEQEKVILPPHTPIFPKKPPPPKIIPPRPFFRPPTPPVPAYKMPPSHQLCPPYKRECHRHRQRPFFRPPPPPVPAPKPFFKPPPPPVPAYKRPPRCGRDPYRRCLPPVPVVEEKPFLKKATTPTVP